MSLQRVQDMLFRLVLGRFRKSYKCASCLSLLASLALASKKSRLEDGLSTRVCTIVEGSHTCTVTQIHPLDEVTRFFEEAAEDGQVVVALRST